MRVSAMASAALGAGLCLAGGRAAADELAEAYKSTRKDALESREARGRGRLERREGPGLAPLSGPRTWALIVSVLEWEDSASYAAFPKEDRRDERLAALLRSRGVPDGNIVHLMDAAASLARIRSSLSRLLSAAAPGDTLLVYYAGHGARDGRALYMIPHDARGPLAESGWGAREIFDALESSFKGRRAFIAADACHTGALADEARSRRGRISYAVFASAHGNSQSTGNWTFSDSLLGGLSGNGAADGDSDGRVTLGELASHVESEMSYLEEQMPSSAFTGDLMAGTVVALARRDSSAARGRVEVIDGETWNRAHLLGISGSSARVRYAGGQEETVAAERVRPFAAADPLAPGTAVEARWSGDWYPARVLESRHGLHFVRYEGYAKTWDEWIPPARLRKRG